MIDFVVSVACYNNEKEVIQFAQGLRKQTIADRIKLVVTCNSCSNPEYFSKKLKKEYELSEVYIPKENLGYLNGCLYGFRNQKDSYKWGIISNTDIEFSSEYFFENILVIKDESIWCVGPDIVLAETGYHQNPFCVNRPSILNKKLHDFIFTNYLTYSFYFFLHWCKRKIFKPKHVLLNSGFVYGVHGSCFVLVEECIKALLAEDNKIFMYDEEIFIAELVIKNGKKIYFDSRLNVVHNENQTTSFINQRVKYKWKKQSIEYLKSFRQ